MRVRNYIIWLSIFFISTNIALARGGFSVQFYPNNIDNSWLEFNNVEGGAVLTGAVRVTNSSDVDGNAFVYSVDVTKIEDGGVTPGADTDQRTALGSWIHLDQNLVYLKARESKVVQLSIKIPQNVAAKEYIAAIMVKPALKKGSANVNVGGGNGISVVTRVGIRVYVRIKGWAQAISGTPAIDDSNPTVMQSPNEEVAEANQPSRSKPAGKTASSASTTKSEIVEKHGPGDSFDYHNMASTSDFLADKDQQPAARSGIALLYDFATKYRVDEDQLRTLVILCAVIVTLLLMILKLI